MHTCIFVGMYVYTRGVRKKKQIIKIPTIHTFSPILTQIILTLYSITWKFITMFVNVQVYSLNIKQYILY